MNKSIFFLALVLTICCKSNSIDNKLEKLGAYDKQVKIVKLSSTSKEIVFVPMVHFAVEDFYTDVKKKIDSLNNLGYFFYCEEITTKDSDSITLRKYKKLKGVPFSKNARYKQLIDSIYKLKYSVKIMDQPTYSVLGIDSLNGRNVDVSLNDIIIYYESRYGEIKLYDCDFKTSLFQKSICNEKPIKEKIKNSVFIDFRNRNVVTSLSTDRHQKIAIIYGSNHLKGIKEELLKQVFK